MEQTRTRYKHKTVLQYILQDNHISIYRIQWRNLSFSDTTKNTVSSLTVDYIVSIYYIIVASSLFKHIWLKSLLNNPPPHNHKTMNQQKNKKSPQNSWKRLTLIATQALGWFLTMSDATPSYTMPNDPLPIGRPIWIFSRGTSHSSAMYTAVRHVLTV